MKIYIFFSKSCFSQSLQTNYKFHLKIFIYIGPKTSTLFLNSVSIVTILLRLFIMFFSLCFDFPNSCIPLIAFSAILILFPLFFFIFIFLFLPSSCVNLHIGEAGFPWICKRKWRKNILEILLLNTYYLLQIFFTAFYSLMYLQISFFKYVSARNFGYFSMEWPSKKRTFCIASIDSLDSVIYLRSYLEYKQWFIEVHKTLSFLHSFYSSQRYGRIKRRKHSCHKHSIRILWRILRVWKFLNKQ